MCLLFPGDMDADRLLTGDAFLHPMMPHQQGDAEQTFEALKPGDYSLRVVVRNAQTGDSEGYLFLPLKVSGGVAQQVIE